MITRTPISTVDGRLEASLTAWRDAALISPEQADAIRSFETAAAAAIAAPSTDGTARRRVPVVAEALGYLGGMLGTIGLVLLAAQAWSDMSTGGRLAATIGGMVVLTVAGLLVPHRDDPALERLRGFVFTGATASGAMAGGMFAKDVLDASWVPSMVLGAAVVVTAHSLALWWHHDRPLQQATFLIGSLVAIGTLAAEVALPVAAGLVVWTAAAMILLAGLLERTPRSALTVAIGAAGMVVGSAITLDGGRGEGLTFTLATTAMLLVLAATTTPVQRPSHRLVLAIVSGVGLLQAGPQWIMWFGQGAGIATGLFVAAVGVAVLLAARTSLVATQVMAQLAGGALLVVGAAVTGMESVAFATLFGLLVAVTLIALGTIPDHALLTIFGCVGLLVNVPWAISHFFPGEGRAPLLTAVSGVLIVGVAVWLAHQGGQLRHQFRHHAPRA